MNKRQKEAVYSWLQMIQDVIAAHTVQQADISKNMPGKTARGWVWLVLENIVVQTYAVIQKDKKADGVMGMAGTIGKICLYWYWRIRVAKIYDERRPVECRQNALLQLMNELADILEMLSLEPNNFDKKLFDDQKKWGLPI